MDLIIGTIAACGVIAYGVVKRVRDKNKFEELLDEQVGHFLQKVLDDKLVFQKINKTSILTNHFFAVEHNHHLDVYITSTQITCVYFVKEKRKRKIIYRYIFDRTREIGQILEMDEKVILYHDVLFRKLEQKIKQYNWENPLAYYAKETARIFRSKSTNKQPSNPKWINDPELLSMIQSIETLYITVKEDADRYFDTENKYKLERLMYNDFENLKKTYRKIEIKTQEEDEKMKQSLALILEKLNEYNALLDENRKVDFEKTIEVIKKRD